MITSDIGNGVFDGAHLVLNFELMNPHNTWWSKYYNVFAKADTEGPRFKGFERWWSTFYFMNEAEIRWIVENLFIGNKLQGGQAFLGGRAPVDLKEDQGADHCVRQQGRRHHAAAAGPELDPGGLWRRARDPSSRPADCLHGPRGHRSSRHFRLREGRAERSTTGSSRRLEMIEALAPGLYEMRIEKKIGEGTSALLRHVLRGKGHRRYSRAR